MKKHLKYLLIIFLIFFIYSPAYASQQGYVDASIGLVVRSNAGTTYSKVTTLSNKTQVTITDTKNTSDGSSGCTSKVWYYITSGSTKGYVCSSYIIITSTENVSSSEIAKMSDTEFEKYLTNQGFPSSYQTKLKTLHKAHPNWIFKGVNAKYTWDNTLSQEQVKGRSLYQVTSTGIKNGLQGYLDTSSAYYNYETDKFTALDGSTWFQANSQTIQYFMDPRNFLTESGIFMFEDLTFYESYQTSAVVKKILYTDFYSDYINHYLEGAKSYNVSPVYLAALSRQEVGLNSSTATSGKAGTYNNVNYDGYYNFYNIGATSGANPVYNGLAYAKSAGWNSPQKAITGGANWIVSGYISKGQYTRYFQKWNVSPTTQTAIYHQYMTDIHALVSPAATTASSYNSMGITNEAIVFTIPIYSGIPSSTSLPSTGNPNNYLSSLKVDDKSVSNFKGSTTSYDLGTVENDKTSINITTTTVNSNASVSGNGKINLNIGKNTIKIDVTAQNGSKKTYTLTVTRKEGVTQNNTPQQQPAETPKEEISISKILNNISVKNTSSNIYGLSLGYSASTLSQNILKQNPNSVVKITDSSNKTKASTLSTGDKVTITSNKETKTFDIVIYGDINGDGTINAKDLLGIRKYLLKEGNLSGAYLEAAKINKSGSVTAKDLLTLRKYLLGTQNISQT